MSVDLATGPEKLPNRTGLKLTQCRITGMSLLFPPFPFLLGNCCRHTQYGSIWVQVGLLFEAPYWASPFSGSRYFCAQHGCRCFGGSQRHSILSCFAAVYNMSSPTRILENCLYLMPPCRKHPLRNCGFFLLLCIFPNTFSTVCTAYSSPEC